MGKSEETKANLLVKALEIMAAKGYASTTTKEISDAAGIAEGTLFKYFKNKENLLSTLLGQWLDHLRHESIDQIREKILLNDEITASEKLILLYEDRMAFFTRHKRIVQVMLQELSINPMVGKLFNDIVLPTIFTVVNQIMDEGIRTGEFRDLPKEVMTIGYTQLMLAPFSSKVMFDGVMNDQLEKNHKLLVEIFIDGIRRSGHE